MLVPVILCGGSGTRLWPLSRKSYPKQLLALTGKQTLLQQTVSRLTGLADIAPPIVVCNEQHRFVVAEQLREITAEQCTIILEPAGRNTCPAVTVAAMHAGEAASLLVLPADHLIADVPRFEEAVGQAEKLAIQGNLVTFGVKPSHAETGYGYLKVGAACEGGVGFVLDLFVEKPDVQVAEGYVESADYYWNSGMFLFQAEVFLRELQCYSSEMVRACLEAYAKGRSDLDFFRLDADSFLQCPDDSIDYAVMEKTGKGVVVPVDIGWNDIGSWSALLEVGSKDPHGNVTRGDVLLHGTKNSYIHAETRLVATAGLHDHIVIETADAVLVAARDHVQDVKKLVARLQQQDRPETNLHRRVYRPWGSYECVCSGDCFQVKLITVHPGSSLSVQMHSHRAEHWVVVRGVAQITRGDDVFILTENESTFIPLGVRHCLENSGQAALELIEVQSGTYLGEDDIVRFEDAYGRVLDA